MVSDQVAVIPGQAEVVSIPVRYFRRWCVAIDAQISPGRAHGTPVGVRLTRGVVFVDLWRLSSIPVRAHRAHGTPVGLWRLL